MSGQIQFDPPQPVDLTALLPGYEVHDLIATGGMGAVYRATHISLDRTVAIKVLPAEFADASFHEQFQAEARAMAKLNHPNLIGIYDFGTTSTGLPFIVMEFVAGKSLYYSAYQKAIEESTAVRITREICEGLAQAHSNNIVHRDIKPANILMDPDAHAKIGDFGLASQTDSNTQHTSDDVVYGTPGYAAPEIVHNPAAIGKPSDIFAVGVILYELLTGHLPDPEHPKPASRVANTDPRLDRVIRKATHSNPAMRYQDAGEMAEDLIKITSTSPPGNHSSPRGTGRLNKRSGPVQVKPGKRSGSVPISTGPVARVTKSGRIMAAPEKSAPVLSRPKKITGKISRTSEHYEENNDLSQEKKVSSPQKRRKRPKNYTGPQIPDNQTSPVRRQATPAKPNTNWPFIRNLCIIFLLAPILYFAWGKYQDKQDRIKAQETQNRLKKELKLQKEREQRELLSQNIDPNAPGKQANTQSGSQGSASTQNPDSIQIFSKEPLDQLRELKSSLANGARTVLPDTAITRGTQILMPISKKMSWSEACRFAEEHGAHLATPTTEAQLAWFSSNLPQNMNQIWIGGGAQGESGWGWVTGEPWTHRKPSTTLGSCATLTTNGTIKAKPNATQLPFFLQWDKSGKNNSDITSQLERLKATINNPTPIWPPGTFSFQARHYLFIQHPVTWEEADLIANAGGGHLAVLSDRVESSYLHGFLQETLKPNQKIWLGGFRINNQWTWSTGEAFIHPKWIAGAPNQQESNRGLRFVHGSRGQSGWDNANPYDFRNVDGFLIEWSKDKKSKIPGKIPTPTGKADKLTNLQSLGHKKLSQYIDAHKKLLQESANTLIWDIDSWHNRLPKTRKEQYADRLQEYKKEITQNRSIPRDLDRLSMPSGIRLIYDSALESQERFEKNLNKKILNLRNSYLSKLLEAKDTAKQSELTDEVSKIEREITAIGQDANSFRKHFRKAQ